jgi:anti-anti-sigma factor
VFSKVVLGMLVGVEVRDDIATVVVVSGDLDDASTVDFVGRVLDATVDTGLVTPVVLDLSNVDFCDGAGVLAMIELERALAPRSFVLRAPGRIVARLLAMTGFERLLQY